MRTLVLFSPGPHWIEGKPVGDQDRGIIGRHLVRMKALFDAGTVLFGGPYMSGFAGMAILETDSSDEAARLMDADPAVEAGVMTYSVASLRPFFDAFSGHSWAPAAA